MGLSVLCGVSGGILSSALPARPPASVLQHVLLHNGDKGKHRALPRAKRYFRSKSHWMDCSGRRRRSEEGVWRAESSAAQILRGEEALQGEIRALQC